MTDLKNLKPGDKVCFKVIDRGEILYEGPGEVTELRNGKLFTKFDSWYFNNRSGMEWNEKRQTWKCEERHGERHVYICPADDETMYRKTKRRALSSEKTRMLLDYLNEVRASAAPEIPKPRAKAARLSKPVR